MNSEKSISLKPGVLIKISLIVLHPQYTYIVPQEIKAQQNQSIPAGKPVETRISHLTVHLFLIKKLKYWGCQNVCRLSQTVRHFGLELRYVHDQSVPNRFYYLLA